MTEQAKPDWALKTSRTEARARAVSEATRAVAVVFGISPESPRLVEALTHPSFSHEVEGAEHNQRLEFLGDSVLNFLVSEVLFAREADAQEGQLTRLRASIVSTEALAEFGREVGVVEALRLGRGGAFGPAGLSPKVIADAVEALIAAVYLDQGLDSARSVVARLFEAALARSSVHGSRDPKSELQERVQAAGLPAPTYRVVERRGPAHDTTFIVEVLIDGQARASGLGRSRRAAEAAAASAALAEDRIQRAEAEG